MPDGPLVYKAAGREFKFYMRAPGYGRSRYHIAVNIKCYVHDPPLSAGYRKKLDKLEAPDGKAGGSRLKQLAFDSCVEQFWDWAKERALELVLGDVYSDGRSGGWLYLHRWTEEYLGSVCTAVDVQCNNCDQPYEQHVDGKCLFESAQFETPQQEYLTALTDIEVFIADVKAYVAPEYAAQCLAEELEQIIDYEWEQYIATRSSRSRPADGHRTQANRRTDHGDDDASGKRRRAVLP